MRYYKRTDNGKKTGKTTTVESYSHDAPVAGAIEIDRAEFDTYIASLPEPVIVPPRDLAAEVDSLTARMDAIEAQIPFTTG